jgi:pSer/pThr/pTyr-binding forkhead associated (FHA) protein
MRPEDLLHGARAPGEGTKEKVIMARFNVIQGPNKGQSFGLTGDTLFIGRSSKNDIQIKDSTISRKQIKIFLIGSKIFVEDLKSTNGTLINEKPITPGEGYEVGEGDTITLGKTVIQVASAPSDPFALRPRSPEGPPKEDRRARVPKDLELIYRVVEAVREGGEMRESCERVLQFLLDALPRVDRAALLLVDEETGEVNEVVSLAKGNLEAPAQRFSRSVVERVTKEGKAMRMSDTAYEAPEEFSENMNTLKIRSVLCVPLVAGGRTLGVIYVDSIRGPYGFRKDDLLLLNSLSGPVALAIENARLALKTGSPKTV